MTPYYIVVVFEDGEWRIEYGSYDHQDAYDEVYDYIDKGEIAMTLVTTDDQQTIDDTIKAVNRTLVRTDDETLH